MRVHGQLSATEAADRLALRELFDAYAHCADRREPEVRRRSSPTTPSSRSIWTGTAANRLTSSTDEKP
jgi:hypothetical protein